MNEEAFSCGVWCWVGVHPKKEINARHILFDVLSLSVCRSEIIMVELSFLIFSQYKTRIILIVIAQRVLGSNVEDGGS